MAFPVDDATLDKIEMLGVNGYLEVFESDPVDVPRWMSALGIEGFPDYTVDDVVGALIQEIRRLRGREDFSPFGRSEAALNVTEEDEKILSGEPEPPVVVVPLEIDPEYDPRHERFHPDTP